jgi:signal transduction histidine kinase
MVNAIIVLMLMVQTAMTFATLLGIVLYQCEVSLASNRINSSVILQQHSYNQMSQLNYESRASKFKSYDDLMQVADMLTKQQELNNFLLDFSKYFHAFLNSPTSDPSISSELYSKVPKLVFLG